MLSVRNSIQKMLEHQFRAADRHNPDCSAITDSQLQQAIASRWPVVDGVAQIPFGFSNKPLWSSVFNLMHATFLPEQIQANLAEMMQTTLRFALKIIEQASQGKIEFIEDKNTHIFSRGIFFYLGGDEKKFFAQNMNAYAHLKIDNNGYIQQAYIFMPSDVKYWDHNANILFMYIWIHEIMHALGFDHLHEFPDMRSILQNTQDGLYCSVLPYANKISTAISQCTTHCNPPYTVYPGSLDKRLLQLAYTHGVLATDDFEINLNYFQNCVDIAIFSIFSAALYKNIFMFFTHLTDADNQPILTSKMAALLADLTFATAIYFLETPLWLMQLFAITAAIKYLPGLDRLPKHAKTALENLSLPALNLGVAFTQGQQPIPLALSSLGSLDSTWLGGKLHCRATLFATLAQVPRFIRPPTIMTDIAEEVAADIESQNIPAVQASVASTHTHAFFNAKRRVSRCMRFTNWIRGNKTIDENENQDLLTTIKKNYF